MTHTDTPVLKTHEFERICRLAHERCGIHLTGGKEQLVSSRLTRAMRAGGFRSFEAYYDHVVADRSGEALVGMIDCLTTNHTSFLREPDHFTFLAQQVAPQYAGRDVLRIWSAACSTAEEVFSILFTLDAAPGPRPRRTEMLATDISTRALGLARRAAYTRERIGTLPREWAERYFTRTATAGEPTWTVKPEWKNRVRFERLNLVDPLPAATWPVIFCRNVMIYFDRETRERLVQRLAAALEPGGYLFIGHAETLIGLDQPLAWVRPAVYRKAAAAR